jgi:hypothetical protein
MRLVSIVIQRPGAQGRDPRLVRRSAARLSPGGAVLSSRWNGRENTAHSWRPTISGKRRVRSVHDHLTGTELRPRFVFAGERIPLINPQRGIFKPHQMQFLLSIKTVFPKPGGKVNPALTPSGGVLVWRAPLAGMNCVQLTFRSARVGTFAGDKPHRSREDNNAQVNSCCWLLSVRSVSASNDASANSSAGRHDHASALGMRPR